MLPAIAGVALSATLAGAAYRLDLFDGRGSAIAGAAGTLISLAAGLRWLLLLLAFVLIGTVATNLAMEWKHRRGISEGSDGRRSGRNVVANGGVPIFVVIVAGTGVGDPAYLVPLYAGAVATATADTLSSEIGMLGGPPRLVTAPWRTVEPGVDGGVSTLGELCAVAGAAAIAVLAAGFFGVEYLLPTAVGGFLGCQMDSLLGATLERRRLMNNEGVNLLATATGALLALLAYVA